MATNGHIIWQPGGTASGNIFITWATAFAAWQAAQGAVDILVDVSLGAASIPAGTYACRGLNLRSFPPNPCSVSLVDTAILKDLRMLDGISLQCACSTSKAIDFSFTNNVASLLMSSDSQIVMGANAGVAACQIPAGKTLGVSLYPQPEPEVPQPEPDKVFDASAGTKPVFALQSTNGSSPSVLNVIASGWVAPAGDWFSGGNVAGACVLNWAGDSTCPIIPSSSLFSGTLNSTYMSTAQHVAYTASNLGNWNNGVGPTEIKGALDRIAAALAAAGHKP